MADEPGVSRRCWSGCASLFGLTLAGGLTDGWPGPMVLDPEKWMDIRRFRVLRDAGVSISEIARETLSVPEWPEGLLDEVEHLCVRCGEPNLAVLVVNKSTREPTKYADRPDY